MKKIILLSALFAANIAMAQNKVNLTLSKGTVESYNTTEVNSIDIDGGTVVVNPVSGVATTYNGTVSNISFVKNQTGHVVITEAGGWFETTYVKWEPFAGATNYYVYVKGGDYSDYTRLDYQLVRNYGTYGRADMVGLKAGTYTMKVVPVVEGQAKEDAASETSALVAKSHDRSGFAHFNYTEGIGAYNNDGTLKSDAKVFYVTANTAKTISTDVTTTSKGATTTATGFQAIIDAYQKGYDQTPICFRIIGCLDKTDMDALSSSSIGLQVKGKNNTNPLNITIEGIGDDATLHFFGILLRNAVSVEVRNLGLLYFPEDGISLDTDNAHCWIHNLDMFYGENKGGDKAKGDGSMDVKGNSQYITFSYNHYWDSGKSSLCGMTSETGPNWITYHHNWFDHSDSRHPRVRTMSVHVYNNYFDGVAKYGVGSTTGSDVFVENNYFRDCKYPMLTSKQGSDVATDATGTFSGEDGGTIKAFGNILKGAYYYRPYSESNTTEYDAYEVSSRDETVPASVVAKQGGATYSNWDTDNSLMYAYTPDAAAEVPAILKGVYGAGRINHGDFKWTFNNNTQDTNYNVISELSTAIQGYDSFLVGLYEGETTIGNGGVGFTSTGGDSSEGDELPFGDGNKADGGTVTPTVPAGDAFIASADGNDYFWFNSENESQANAWITDGTITLDAGSSFKPTFSNPTYTTYTGSIQLATGTGYAIFKCPSVAVFKLQLLRTGSYAGNIYTSTDGSNFTKVTTLSGSKGNQELDLSAYVKSTEQIYVKIENTSTGGLNIHGAYIIKAAQE